MMSTGLKKNPRDASEPKLLYHMGPGGSFEEDNFYRRNVKEYPDFGSADKTTITGASQGGFHPRPSSSLSLAHSQKKIIKANAPFRSTILKQIIASLKKHSSVRQSTDSQDR